MVILTRFPPPPGAAVKALEQLEVLRRGDADEMAAAGDLTDLPRPWDPATCPDDLREVLWGWCDRVRPRTAAPSSTPTPTHQPRSVPPAAADPTGRTP